MTPTKIKNPKWQCRVCGDARYQVIKREPVSDPDTGKTKWLPRVHICRGCSVMFQDPHLFNKGHDND